MSISVKNCHSPAGMGFVADKRLTTLTDCPKCKYGTLIYDGEKHMLCADCSQRYTITLLRAIGILPKASHGGTKT